MASMVIRNIPDEAVRDFKAKAKAHGKSTEQMARELIVREAGMSSDEAWAALDRIREHSKPVSGQQIIDQIRWDRENNLGRKIPGIDE